jgi:hypothetical protein
MAGLLDNLFNTEQGRMGLGLLAAGSARGDGAGFGQRLSEAVGSVDQWKQQQAQAKRAKMQEEYQAFQMQQAMAQAEQQKLQQADEAKRRSIFAQNFQPAIPASADGMGPTRAMGFDHNNAAIQMGQAGMGEQAMDLMAKFAPKPADYKVVGNSLLQVGNDGVKPVYSEPEKQKEIDPNKPFMMVGGKIVPNEAFQAFDLRKASNSAPKMSVDLRDPTAVANAGMKLQDAYRAATKPSYARAQAYEAMTEASKNPSAKGDLTMVYSFVKALDPESVVREGEISLLNANRSVPDSIKGYAQRLATGQSLLPKEREDLLNQARTLTQTDYKRSRNDIKAYRENATRLGLDPELYTPDPYATFKPKEAEKTVVRTGVMNGKKVVQYSDGTTDYAN